jgi:hypothetical protein
MKLFLPICLFAVCQFAFGVPTEINYQGRLTYENGNPTSGSKVFSLKVFDAASGGNQLYSETIGSVEVDDNGIYNFQFGASGTSTVSVTETIDVTDGIGNSFGGTPSQTPLAGTLNLSDGTYSWDELGGTWGEQAYATATLINGFIVSITVTDGGEGYTDPPAVTISGNGSGATVSATVNAGVISSISVNNPGSGYTNASMTIERPPVPFVVEYTGGNLTFTYDTAPAVGTKIEATYDAGVSSIANALGEGSNLWLELTVNGQAQATRERILCVPFAKVAQTIVSENSLAPLVEEILFNSSLLIPSRFQRGSMTLDQTLSDGHAINTFIFSKMLDDEYVRYINVSGLQSAQYVNIWLNYADGSSGFVRTYGSSGNVSNPSPEKVVQSIDFNRTGSYIDGSFRNTSVVVLSDSEKLITFGSELAPGRWFLSLKTDINTSSEYNITAYLYDDTDTLIASLSKENPSFNLASARTLKEVQIVSAVKNTPQQTSNAALLEAFSLLGPF